jgi:transposase
VQHPGDQPDRRRGGDRRDRRGPDPVRLPEHLTSWAGVYPDSNESAGRVKSTKTRPGNAHLKGALGIAALAVTDPHGSYLGAKYRRITSRGLSIAIVAIERAILVIIGQMSRTRAFYQDLGVDHYTRPDPERVNDGPQTTRQPGATRSPVKPPS